MFIVLDTRKAFTMAGTETTKPKLPLIDRLKLAVWMVGNIDTEDDKDSWWLTYNDLWEEIKEDACEIAKRVNAETEARMKCRIKQ